MVGYHVVVVDEPVCGRMSSTHRLRIGPDSAGTMFRLYCKDVYGREPKVLTRYFD